MASFMASNDGARCGGVSLLRPATWADGPGVVRVPDDQNSRNASLCGT